MDARTTLTLIVGLAAGLAAGWLLKPAERVGAGAELRAEPFPDEAAPPELGTELTVLRAELDQARTEREAALQRSTEAEQREAQLRREVESLREAVEKGTTPDAPKLGAGVRYAPSKYAKALQAIDWDVAGDAVAHISPLLEELAAAIRDGKPYPPSVGQIQRYNGSLVTAALKAQQEGMPGTGVNGAFTHVSVQANLVHATLLKAGKPLSAEQETTLGDLADDLLREDERRLAGYDESTFALQKLVEEAALKDRFYAGVDALVTQEQREILHPAGVRGRVSFDMFSSGLVWATVMAPRRFKTTRELVDGLVAQVTGRFEVPQDHKAVVEDAAAEWAKSFPPGYLDEPADALAASGRFRVEHVRIAAERQLAFFRTLVARMPAGWAGASQVRDERFVAVPLRK